MFDFEKWLLQKQKMNLHWFNTMIPDKRPYWQKWYEYKRRKAEFDAACTRNACEEATREIIKLGR